MKSPAQDMADMMLESASPVDGTDVFVSVQPEAPLDCITFYNTGGWGNAPNYDYARPTILALVRSSTYEAGYALALAVKSHLHGRNNVKINGARYVQILCEGDIHDLAPEPSRQHYEFSVNFATHRTTTP
jgi:hypothetical protein